MDLANALDLSESEEEDELEDLIEDFALQADMEQVRFSPTTFYHPLSAVPRIRVFDKKDYTFFNSQAHFLLSCQKHPHRTKC